MDALLGEERGRFRGDLGHLLAGFDDHHEAGHPCLVGVGERAELPAEFRTNKSFTTASCRSVLGNLRGDAGNDTALLSGWAQSNRGKR